MKIMNILQIHNLKPQFPCTFRTVPHHSLSGSLNFSLRKSTRLSSSSFLLSLVTPIRPTFKIFTVSRIEAPFFENNKEDEEEDEERNSATNLTEFEDLAPDGVVYRNTLRLVECSMFAAVTGLVYFLSNSLSIENYFGCFFSLPIVISSLRWGVAGGRKTMVATAMLLFVLSGPVKALTYLLTHGLVGFTMGSLWRMGANWGLSIFLCTIVVSPPFVLTLQPLFEAVVFSCYFKNFC
ncbi:hypothetical protein H0E87_015932 [Populus deltoides]|uniref:Uncharacterized protein n=1 Tax=Populus deltoides TaxID=3696 RepID=A0A8T2Y760_POPDE|nr:hypothetical protein H0E87_015932 [Populus deltoides]